MSHQYSNRTNTLKFSQNLNDLHLSNITALMISQPVNVDIVLHFLIYIAPVTTVAISSVIEILRKEKDVGRDPNRMAIQWGRVFHRESPMVEKDPVWAIVVLTRGTGRT